MWWEYFSFKFCPVFHQSALELSYFDQNWVKTRPLLFKIWKFSNSMDSRIVHWWSALWSCLAHSWKGACSRSDCWTSSHTYFWTEKRGRHHIFSFAHSTYLWSAKEVWRRCQVHWHYLSWQRTWNAQVWKIIPKCKWSDNSRKEQSQLLLGAWPVQVYTLQAAGVGK